MAPQDEIKMLARWRVVCAFAIVPGVAALLFAFVQPLYQGLGYVEQVWRTALVVGLVAYPLGLAIGVPAYFFLRERLEATWLNCSLAGALIAALPWTLLVMLGPSADQASIGGKATIIDGTKTLYGVLLDLQFIGTIALFGAIAGLVFWAIAAAKLKIG